MIISLLYFALIIVTVCVVLPKMPKWARVGFWATLAFTQIVTDDALFAAIYAAIMMAEWNES